MFKEEEMAERKKKKMVEVEVLFLEHSLV